MPETDEADPATDALDDAAECIAKAIGAIDAGFKSRILGEDAKRNGREIGNIRIRAQNFARRIAVNKLAPFYPMK